MRYLRSVCCLIVSVVFLVLAHSSIQAQDRRADHRDRGATATKPSLVAPKSTRFFLFNTTPNGNYQILKNGSPLTSVVASPRGVLALTEIVDFGDILAFSLDGVQTQPPAPPGNVIAIEGNPGCVTVSWLAGGEPDLAGYTVYYGGQSVSGGQASAYDDSVAVGLTTSHWQPM